MEEIYCFFCGGRETRKHSLGRIYCRSCHRRYSLKRTQRLKKIIEYFALEIPANKACRFLKLNYKTVHRVYQNLRIKIHDTNKFFLFEDLPLKQGEKSKVLVLIVEAGDKIFTQLINPGSFGEVSSVEGKIVKEAQKQGYKIILLSCEKFKSYKSLVKTYSKGLDNFWIFAKKRLEKYRAISKKNFELYLSELAFRYNNEESDLAGGLFNLWQKIPNNQKA